MNPDDEIIDMLGRERTALPAARTAGLGALLLVAVFGLLAWRRFIRK